MRTPMKNGKNLKKCEICMIPEQITLFTTVHDSHLLNHLSSPGPAPVSQGIQALPQGTSSHKPLCDTFMEREKNELHVQRSGQISNTTTTSKHKNFTWFICILLLQTACINKFASHDLQSFSKTTNYSFQPSKLIKIHQSNERIKTYQHLPSCSVHLPSCFADHWAHLSRWPWTRPSRCQPDPGYKGLTCWDEGGKSVINRLLSFGQNQWQTCSASISCKLTGKKQVFKTNLFNISNFFEKVVGSFHI